MKYKYFKDIVYGHIVLPEALVESVVDKPIFQRLRWIRQTSATNEVYPSLEGSRFQHSLGAAHIIGDAIDWIINNTLMYSHDMFDKEKIMNITQLLHIIRPWAQFAALVHDIGHVAFSHLFEEALSDAVNILGVQIENYKEENQLVHEDYGRSITHALLMEDDVVSTLMNLAIEMSEFSLPNASLTNVMKKYVDILRKSKPQEIAWLVWNTVFKPLKSEFIPLKTIETNKELNSLVDNVRNIVLTLISGSLDVDRADYILRDAALAGVRSAAFDLDRYVAVLLLVPNEAGNIVQVGVLEKGISMIESFLLARFHLYSEVYTHKVVMIYNGILRRILSLLVQDTKSGIVIPPIRLFDGKRTTPHPKLEEIEREFLQLTDSQILSKIVDLYLAGDTIPEPLRTLVTCFLTHRHCSDVPDKATCETKGTVQLMVCFKLFAEGSRRKQFAEIDEELKGRSKKMLENRPDLVYCNHPRPAFKLSADGKLDIMIFERKLKRTTDILSYPSIIEKLKDYVSIGCLLLRVCPTDSKDFKFTSDEEVGELKKLMNDTLNR